MIANKTIEKLEKIYKTISPKQFFKLLRTGEIMISDDLMEAAELLGRFEFPADVIMSAAASHDLRRYIIYAEHNDLTYQVNHFIHLVEKKEVV